MSDTKISIVNPPANISILWSMNEMKSENVPNSVASANKGASVVGIVCYGEG